MFLRDTGGISNDAPSVGVPTRLSRATCFFFFNYKRQTKHFKTLKLGRSFFYPRNLGRKVRFQITRDNRERYHGTTQIPLQNIPYTRIHEYRSTLLNYFGARQYSLLPWNLIPFDLLLNLKVIPSEICDIYYAVETVKYSRTDFEYLRSYFYLRFIALFISRHSCKFRERFLRSEF